jgi:phosphate acetyltransferase
VDGEFQLDTAVLPAVAAKKVKRDSEVAGKANILIFPDLTAANIGIKMIQIFAGGKGYGHTLSGFNKPVADSSRGSSVEEIVGDIAMVIIAAQS